MGFEALEEGEACVHNSRASFVILHTHTTTLGRNERFFFAPLPIVIYCDLTTTMPVFKSKHCDYARNRIRMNRFKSIRRPIVQATSWVLVLHDSPHQPCALYPHRADPSPHCPCQWPQHLLLSISFRGWVGPVGTADPHSSAPRRRGAGMC